MHDKLRALIAQLRLHGMAEALDAEIERAEREAIAAPDLLYRLLSQEVSTITLFDGPVITEIDVLPASASGLLYGGREVEAGSDGSAAPLSRFIGFVVVSGSRVAERPPFACAPASGGCR
jgi:hypothetical protein